MFRNQYAPVVRDAILHGEVETVKRFLDQGVDPNESAFIPNNPKKKFEADSFLGFAAETGNLPMVKLLVERGAYTHHATSSFSDSGIKAAVKSNHTEVALYLLQKEANANAGFTNETCITKAAKKGNIPLVEILVQYGADINDSFQSAIYKYRKLISGNERTINDCDSRIAYYIKTKIEGFNPAETIKKLEDERAKAIKELDHYKKTFKCIIKTLLDCSVGKKLNLYDGVSHIGFPSKPLYILNGMDISDFTFIGITISRPRGSSPIPITRKLLDEYKLEGADKAIVDEA